MWFVASMLSVATACCLLAAVVRDDRVRPIAAWTGAGGLLSLGVLGIFSIGLPLLVAGILMVVAALRIGVAEGGGAAAAAGFFVAALVPWALLLLG